MNASTIMNLAAVVCFTLGIDGCCCKPENQQRKMERDTASTPTESSEAPAKVEAPKDDAIYVDAVAKATKLYEDYEANEVRADAKYKGKRLAVGGYIDSIDKDFLDNIVVVIRAGGLLGGVRSTLLDSEKSKAADMNKGERIFLICDGGGRVMHSPILRKCLVVDGETRVKVSK